MGGCFSTTQAHTVGEHIFEEAGEIDVHDEDHISSLGSHSAVERLREAALKSVVVLAGAGISVSAGIPDFRSRGTGLYDNLQKYNLPNPQAVFELSYFRKHPEAFTHLAKELWPSNFSPTLAHYFIRLLQDKGLLRRHYTQNVDGLDRAAGIQDDLIVEAHGSFGAGHCIDCHKAYTAEFIRGILFQSKVVKCTTCKGLVKPDIVFFGEGLPDKFFTLSEKDFFKASVVLCLGTSLTVAPFATLADKSKSPNARHILINRELPQSYNQRSKDLTLLGDCDAKILELAGSLGWTRDLQELVARHRHEMSKL